MRGCRNHILDEADRMQDLKKTRSRISGRYQNKKRKAF